MKYLIIILFLFTSVIAFSQRHVYWLHGYQGDDTSFRKVGDDVGGIDSTGNQIGRFQVVSEYLDYNPNQSSLAVAAQDVRNEMQIAAFHRQGNTANDFMIAHSMGGLVARKLGVVTNSSSNNLLNGLITFGTPHQGAYAADVLQDQPSKLEAFLNNACNALTDGPAHAGLAHSNSFWVRNLGTLAIHLGLMQNIRTKICNTGINLIMDRGIDFFSEGVEDELKTSRASQIPPMQTAHNAVFYGEETDDGTMTHRFMGAFYFNPPDSFSLYEAHKSDTMGIDSIQKFQDYYMAQMNYWIYKHTHFPRRRDRYIRTGLAYANGVEWFNTLDDGWKELIGANQSYLVKDGCVCDYEDYYGNFQVAEFVGASMDCDDLESTLNYPDPTCRNRYRTVTVENLPSDGFILTESAMNTPNLHYPPQKMQGSNHMQMKNDINMKIAVDKIFYGKMMNGTKDTNDFFYTEER